MSSLDKGEIIERALFVLPYFAGSTAVACAIALLQPVVRGERFQLRLFLQRTVRSWALIVVLSPLLLVAKCVAFFASIDGCINC